MSESEVIIPQDKSHKWLVEENRILSKLCKVIDLYDVLEIMVDEVVALGEFDGITVDLIDDERKYMACEMAHLPPEYKAMEKTYRMLRVPLEVYDNRIEELTKGTPITFKKKNIDKYSPNVSNQMQRWRVRSQMVLPIIFNDSPVSGVLIGIITVFYQNLDEIPQEVGAKVERIIAYFINSIYNAKQHSSLKKQQESIRSAVEEQQRFLNFVSEVNNLTTPDSIYELFCDEFIHRFSFDIAGIFMEENERLVCKKNVTSEIYKKKLGKWNNYVKNVSYELKQSDGAIVVAFLQKIHVYVPDVKEIMHLPMSDNDKEGLAALKEPRTLVCMPIRGRDRVYGCLWLWSIGKQIELSDSDLSVIKYLCEFIATAINNSFLYETIETQNKEIKSSKIEIESLYSDLEKKAEVLRTMATTDKLTGLKNFAFFQEELGRRINEYRRCKGELFLSLVIFDIDHFKLFNDTHGHIGGNIALEDVASRIGKAARQMDIVCRYGGEEFIVILPKCNLEGARGFAERVREAVQDEPVQTDTVSVPVTISCGCAEYYPDEIDEKFIERADGALYRAKEGGRNRVEVSDFRVDCEFGPIE